MRRRLDSKPKSYPESMDVDVVGISGKVSAHYPGRSASQSGGQTLSIPSGGGSSSSSPRSELQSEPGVDPAGGMVQINPRAGEVIEQVPAEDAVFCSTCGKVHSPSGPINKAVPYRYKLIEGNGAYDLFVPNEIFKGCSNSPITPETLLPIPMA